MKSSSAGRLVRDPTYRFLLSLVLLAPGAALAFDAVSPRGGDLSGFWRLDEAASDDVEKMLQERFEKEARERARRMRNMGEDPIPQPPSAAGSSRGERTADQSHAIPVPSARRNERIRRTLGVTRTLHITQEGTRLEIASEAETRRFEAGQRSQISMPGGGLADSRVGWSGQWFVVDRRVRGGIRVVERYRLLKGGEQLESTLAVSGDDFLSGMKVRRIYIRTARAPEPRDPALGPVP